MAVNIALTASAASLAFSSDWIGSALVFAVVLLCTAWLIQRRRAAGQRDGDRGQRQLPPGPWAIPWVGSPQLLSPASHVLVTELGRTYGKAFTLRIGSDPLLVLNDFELIKEALVRHGDSFSDRFTFKTMERTISLKGSLIFENGPAWKTRRRVALTAMRKLSAPGGTMERVTGEEVACLCRALSRLDGRPVEPSRLINAAVANVICGLSYGRRFEYGDPRFERVLADLDAVLHCSFLGSFLKTAPLLSRLPGLGGLRRALAAVFEFNRAMVGEHRARFDPARNAGDVIDAMLGEALEEEARGVEGALRVFTDELIARSIYDLFAAGTDTNTNTLLWAMLLMAKYPDVQSKVKQEIDAVIGPNGRPSLSDSTSMPFTMATIMEVHRYRVAAPFAPPRRATRDVSLSGGLRVPRGTQVWPNLWAALHDASLWDEPEAFRPSRFLADDGKRVHAPEAFIPFGAGSRICLGKQLSGLVIFQCFTGILQSFDLSLPLEGADRVDLQGHLGLTLAPKKYKIRAVQRQCAQAGSE